MASGRGSHTAPHPQASLDGGGGGEEAGWPQALGCAVDSTHGLPWPGRDSARLCHSAVTSAPNACSVWDLGGRSRPRLAAVAGQDKGVARTSLCHRLPLRGPGRLQAVPLGGHCVSPLPPLTPTRPPVPAAGPGQSPEAPPSSLLPRLRAPAWARPRPRLPDSWRLALPAAPHTPVLSRSLAAAWSAGVSARAVPGAWTGLGPRSALSTCLDEGQQLRPGAHPAPLASVDRDWPTAPPTASACAAGPELRGHSRGHPALPAQRICSLPEWKRLLWPVANDPSLGSWPGQPPS